MPESSCTIYHNPRCTKSRATLALLREHGIEPTVVDYLETPPSAPVLKALLQQLGLKPQELVRKGEEIYQRKYAGKALTDAQWIDALVADPILIERPIVVKDGRAVIGRPPQNALALLK